ncbi:MAG: DUF4055 domain-containing protein, partial [Minisyncoccales bacterium]
MPELKKKLIKEEITITSKSTDLSVDNKSQSYSSMYQDWKMINDIMAGDRAIKKAGESYIPKLEGQQINQYDAYLSRGVFFNAFARTVQGLTGAITRKSAVVEVPEKLNPVLDSFTQDGSPLDKTIRSITQTILSKGYCGILADLGENDTPYVSIYQPLDIINFKTIKVNGKMTLRMLVLKERVEVENPLNPFESNITDQIRVLFLDDTGWLTINLYQFETGIKGASSKWIQVPINEEFDYQPSVIGGAKLDYIPFTFFGSEETSYSPQKPPLLDLAYLNIKHWQVNVDYYYALHICALPTPWAAGFTQEEGKNLRIGPGTAWVSSEPEAKCGFLEFTGQGLQAIENALSNLEKQMAVIGARLLEEQKKGVETAESMEIRAGGDTANLASISLSIERGFKQVLVY